MISDKDVETYRRDGVIVVPEVLDGATLGQVRQVIAELVAGAALVLALVLTLALRWAGWG